jgi:hypothetical protein
MPPLVTPSGWIAPASQPSCTEKPCMEPAAESRSTAANSSPAATIAGASSSNDSPVAAAPLPPGLTADCGDETT